MPLSIHEWERRVEQSQRESDERRTQTDDWGWIIGLALLAILMITTLVLVLLEVVL